MHEQKTENITTLKRPTNYKGWLLAGLLLTGFVALTHQAAVPAIYCDDKSAAAKPDIVMLSAAWCTYCKQARRYFSNNNITYCEYDIERSTAGKHLYNRVNGQAVPVLLIGDIQLSGFSENAVKQALNKLHSL